MTFTPYISVWLALALSVLALALYRKLITLHEEDALVHIAASEQPLIPHQVALAHKLDMIDRWGKALTVLTVLFGLLLVAIWLYRGWEAI
ncbi:MAG TPA: hypothetical protein VFW83_06770 [Bryobacteraceae bacterium]|nr:hypothetical protein [Bryobacteraceae bacterium]